MFKTWGLRGRAIAFCVLLLLGTVGMSGAVLIWHSYRESIDEIQEHASTYAKSLSYNAEPAVLLNDQKALQYIVQAAGRNQTVQWAEIQDAQGETLAKFQRFQDFDPELPPDAVHLIEIAGGRTAARIKRSNSKLLVVVPIWPETETNDLDLGLIDDEESAPEAPDRPIGSLRLIYSLDSVYAKIRGFSVSIAAVSVIVVAIGIIVTLLVIEQLLGPVRNLVRTSAAIADGDLQQRVHVRAMGEIGVLASAFSPY